MRDKLLNIFRNVINQKPALILIIILIIHFLAHLIGISDPPNGYHAWRESDTAAVSEAFYKETKNIFEPKTHQRKDKSGITGMEFPIYNYVTALLYHVFGFHHYVPRTLSILIGIIGLLGIYFLSIILFNDDRTLALLAVFLTICSPLFFFFTRKIQPDIIVFTSSIWAFYFFIKAEIQNLTFYHIVALLLVVLAALVKPTALVIGLPMLIFLLTYRFKGKFLKIFQLKYIVFLIASIAIPLAWNFYTRYLNEKYGLHPYYLGGNQIAYWLVTNWSGFFSRIFMSWLFELFLGIPATIGLIIGIVYWRKFSQQLYILGWWILGCYLMFFMVSEHMSNYHDYYGLIVVPPLMIMASFFFTKILGSGNKLLRIFAFLLLIGAAIYTYPRIDQRYGSFKQKDFLAMRALADKYIPSESRITVEDSSPSIQLYRLGRFGWTFGRDSDEDTILTQHQLGAEYIVWYDKNFSESLGSQIDTLYHDDKIFIGKFRNKI
jgi:hypothetical protein